MCSCCPTRTHIFHALHCPTLCLALPTSSPFIFAVFLSSSHCADSVTARTDGKERAWGKTAGQPRPPEAATKRHAARFFFWVCLASRVCRAECLSLGLAYLPHPSGGGLFGGHVLLRGETA